MDVRQMNAQRGHQWVNAMAQCIQTDIKIHRQQAIWELSDQAGGIYGTGSDASGDAGQMLETTIQMQQLLQFYLETSFDI